MTDLDLEIYNLMARCSAARLPVVFCNDGETGKGQLAALLRRQLRESETDLTGECGDGVWREYGCEG